MNKDETSKTTKKETEQLYPVQPLTCSNCGYVREKETSQHPVNYCVMCGVKL